VLVIEIEKESGRECDYSASTCFSIRIVTIVFSLYSSLMYAACDQHCRII
jgi:hypothetical protein